MNRRLKEHNGWWSGGRPTTRQVNDKKSYTHRNRPPGSRWKVLYKTPKNLKRGVARSIENKSKHKRLKRRAGETNAECNIRTIKYYYEQKTGKKRKRSHKVKGERQKKKRKIIFFL
jgi:hypothetical protein